MWVKLTAEQSAKVKEMRKSWDIQWAIDYVKNIQNNATTTTTTTKTNQSNMSTVQTWPANLWTTKTSTNTSTNYSNNNAKVWTWAVAPMPTQNTVQLNTQNTTTTPKTNTSTYQTNMSTKETWPANLSGTTNTQNATNIADYWNSLSYEEQQAKLKSNSALKQYIQKSGLVEKKPQSTKESWPLTPTTQKSTKPEWDYKDNSQARMDEIANNLDKYRVTNPELFDDYSTFYNFFINWKDRSQEQLDFLWNYYNKIKDNNKYDNLSSAQVWNGIANGTIPESYMNDIKNTDPERVNEIKEEKKKAEDAIKNQAYLESLVNQTYDTWDSDFWTWEKKEMLYKDENNDWIEDRLYHEPTAEERAKVDRNFEIESEILDIDYTVKRTYDDLVERYPWASKSTLMAMAQDTNNDLIRKKEDLLVEQTKLQGTIKYLQSERQEMDKAGQTTWDNIERDYGMYLRSPEWLAATTEAQYAATHIWLDEASTPTQQKMALEWVLDWYYDKYGSIIQRPEQQVINDVMNYASKNWVSLSQALQENFIKPLQDKPEFSQLNQITTNPNVVRIWTDANGNPIYWTYNSATGKFDPIDLSGYWITTTTGGVWGKETTPWWVTYTSVSNETKINWLSDFLAWTEVWEYGGQCWAFVNDYLEKIWVWRIYDNNLSTKTNSKNSDTPSVWSVAIFDYSNAPANSTISDNAKKHWHVAIVAWVNEDAGTITIVESNKDWNKLVWVREIPMNNMYLKWYFNPSEWYTGQAQTDSFGGKFANDKDWNTNGYFNSLVPYFKTAAKEWKIDLTDKKWDKILSDYNLTSKEFNEMAKNYANTDLKSGWWQQAAQALEEAIKLYDLIWAGSTVPWRAIWQYARWTDNAKARDYYDTLMKRLQLNELFAAKDLWATFGAMSDSEWTLLENAATDVKRWSSNFNENLEYLIESLYDAALDWKAKMPMNLKESKTEQMLRTRKAEWSGIWNGKFSDDWQTNDIYSDLY